MHVFIDLPDRELIKVRADGVYLREFSECSSIILLFSLSCGSCKDNEAFEKGERSVMIIARGRGIRTRVRSTFIFCQGLFTD